jgi:hypothetical protein
MEVLMDPYIGVTGFMHRTEVNQALATLDNLDREKKRGNRLLMVGVLASSKTLVGGTNKYPKRYPKVEEIASIFPPDRRTLNLIHYATDDQETLGDQLDRLAEIGGPYLDGYQLNMAWPDSYVLEHYIAEHRHQIVLQLGKHALEMQGNDPDRVIEALGPYHSCIDHVLLDLSGGKGIPMDADLAYRWVEKFHERFDSLASPNWTLGIGVAGGLMAGALDPIRKILDLGVELSIDAEGRLRNEADDLQIGEVDAYIREAEELFL